MTTSPKFSPKQLSDREIGAFLEQGFLLLRGVFSKEWAAQIVPLVWQEMPESPGDSTTWTQPVRIVEKVLDNFPVGEILTERYTNAIDDLCGIGTWKTNMGVGYWVNLFPRRASWPMRPQTEDWHIDVRADGNNDESAHLGLNIMEFFTEVNHGGGGTAIRVGSHRYVARLSAEAGHRSTPHELNLRVSAATEHLPQLQITAQAGDVLLMHPFTVHAASSNETHRVRIAAQRPISLFEPMSFARLDPNSYSRIEWAVVTALDQPEKQERAVR